MECGELRDFDSACQKFLTSHPNSAIFFTGVDEAAGNLKEYLALDVLQSAWKRIVKVVMMPDEVMGIKRMADDANVGAGVQDPAASRVK